MLERLISALGNPYIFGVFASGVLVAIALAVGLIHAARRKRGRLETARRGIAAEPREVDAIEAVDRHIPKAGPIRGQWEEFKEGVVRIEGKPFNAIPMGDLLKDEAILQHVATRIPVQIHFPVIDQLPGVATGLGILGTYRSGKRGRGRFSPTATRREAAVGAAWSVLRSLREAQQPPV